jgi:phage regulator Rha-like protein
MPKLKGRTMCLSDNSGSAWGGVTSEYGKTEIAVIDNLSSVIAGACSDEGYVGKFGDALRVFPVSKRDGILTQANAISKETDKDVGGATEGGIWIFFRDAIRNKDVYDNIFIFSDQQAGTGGLYGTSAQRYEYGKEYGTRNGGYIDVYKLIQKYRREVNPKVNVFSIQTAGYDNVLIPAMAYRTAILTGWTGKEIQFASKYIEQWDDIERQKEEESKPKTQQEALDRDIEEAVNQLMKHRKYASKSDERRVRAQLTEKIRRELETNPDDKKTKDKPPRTYNKYNKDKTPYKRYKK